MNCCDEYGNCHQGRDCPVRKTRAAQRAIDEQAKTDKQATSHDDTSDFDSDVSEIVVDGIRISLIVWLVACVFAPWLAGALYQLLRG